VEAGTLALAGVTYKLADGKAELVDHVGDLGDWGN
jgi:carbonic anhydrase